MKNIFTAIIVLFGCVGFNVIGQDKINGPAKYYGGALIGYNRGFGVQANFTVENIATDFPFGIRAGIGLTVLDPGNAADARRIFINNATDGVPEKKGRSFDYRIDLLIQRPVFGINHSFLVFGPRFSTFRGNFKYVGGNEEFDVTSNQWGLGANIEHHFSIAQNLNLIFCYGLDSYFPGTLSGHDTSYSPLNDNVNPQNDNQNDDVAFKYKDANKAIRQPMFMPRFMVGIQFGL
jgi:hypothetical protein